MTWHIYDFFDSPTSSQAWRSKSGLGPPAFVKRLAGDLPMKFSRIECNAWSAGDYIGGLRVNDGQTCVFRICNGGRDRHGRPNRWVLLVVVAESKVCRGTDVLAAVEAPAFSNYAALPVASPAPLPNSPPIWPDEVFGDVRATPDSFDEEGEEAERRARECSLLLSSGGATAGLLIVQRQSGKVKAWFKLEGEKYAPPLTANKQPAKSAADIPKGIGVVVEPRAHETTTWLGLRWKWRLGVLGLLLVILAGLLVRRYWYPSEETGKLAPEKSPSPTNVGPPVKQKPSSPNAAPTAAPTPHSAH